MATDLTTVRTSEEAGVLTIELHRPDRLNALTTEVARDLLERCATPSAPRSAPSS
jgi:enoyl-CoA hydratase/carnithine racemase